MVRLLREWRRNPAKTTTSSPSLWQRRPRRARNAKWKLDGSKKNKNFSPSLSPSPPPLPWAGELGENVCRARLLLGSFCVSHSCVWTVDAASFWKRRSGSQLYYGRLFYYLCGGRGSQSVVLPLASRVRVRRSVPLGHGHRIALGNICTTAHYTVGTLYEVGFVRVSLWRRGGREEDEAPTAPAAVAPAVAPVTAVATQHLHLLLHKRERERERGSGSVCTRVPDTSSTSDTATRCQLRSTTRAHIVPV